MRSLRSDIAKMARLKTDEVLNAEFAGADRLEEREAYIAYQLKDNNFLYADPENNDPVSSLHLQVTR